MLKSMLLFIGVACGGSAADATVINMDYLFNGSRLNSLYSNKVVGAAPPVDDALHLSFKAMGGSFYHGFANFYKEGNVDFTLASTGVCSSHAAHISYGASLNDRGLFASTDNCSTQHCFGGQGRCLGFLSTDILDEFTVSYTRGFSTISDTHTDHLSRSPWLKFWKLFDGREANSHHRADLQAVDVTEPTSLAILGLGLISIGLLGRKCKR